MKHYLKFTASFVIISLILTEAIDYGHKYFKEPSNVNLYWIVPLLVFVCCTIAFLFVYFDEKLRK